MVRTIDDILKDILLLSPELRQELLGHLNTHLIVQEDNEAALIEIRKSHQEKNGFGCPHCSSDNIVGHGNYMSRKRYKCKDCQKTFNELTGTSVDKLHKKDVWKTYIGCISRGLSLRAAAKECQITFRTSFLWRHKILSALKDIGCTKMEGIIEGDETFFLFSEKGNRNIQGRKARKRGGKATKAGINNEHVAVIVSTDRHGDFIAEVAGRGRITANQIDDKIGMWLGDNAEILCTDSHRSYESFAKKKKLKHVKVNVSKGQHVKDKIYHIQNINSIHSLMKDWMSRFKGGVGSSYLQNYMNWFRIQRKLGESLNGFLEYALSSTKAFVAAKDIKPHLFIS
jgi:transposase-like protein